MGSLGVEGDSSSVGCEPTCCGGLRKDRGFTPVLGCAYKELYPVLGLKVTWTRRSVCNIYVAKKLGIFLFLSKMYNRY